MRKKKDDYAPKIAKTSKVTKGRLKGHVHQYTAHRESDGSTYYRCGGCGHAYTSK